MASTSWTRSDRREDPGRRISRSTAIFTSVLSLPNPHGQPGTQDRQPYRQASRRSAAHLVSWCRVESCSLRSTEDTWLSTVLVEMNSSFAISL